MKANPQYERSKEMATSASVVTSVARNIPAPGLGFQFETEENSPFPDGYSIAKEEKIVL